MATAAAKQSHAPTIFKLEKGKRYRFIMEDISLVDPTFKLRTLDIKNKDIYPTTRTWNNIHQQAHWVMGLHRTRRFLKDDSSTTKIVSHQTQLFSCRSELI